MTIKQAVDENNYDQIASHLYDGGWRSEDIDDLIVEYDLYHHEAIEICNRIKSLEDIKK